MTPQFFHPTKLRIVTFDEVKATVSLFEIIDYLGIRRVGRSFQCPNAEAHKHGDRNKSAYIAETRTSWRCYGCGAYGSVIDLYRLAYGISAEEAKEALAEYAGLTPAVGAITLPGPLPKPADRPRPPLAPEEPLPPASPEIHAFLLRAQQDLLTSPHGSAYLETRGIPLSIARAAGLGYAPRGTWPHRRGQSQSRIIAPLTTPDGMLINLYGRSTVACDKGLRHDFLPGPKGIFHARSLAEDGVILVEGVFDALTCLAGGRPAAAICGLAFRDGWWLEITSPRLILALDNDTAGQGDRKTSLEETAARAGKKILNLKPKALEGIKDLNEYWTTHHQLPEPLRRPLRPMRPPAAPPVVHAKARAAEPDAQSPQPHAAMLSATRDAA